MTPHLRQAVLAVTAVLALAVVCAVTWSPRPGAAARPPDAPMGPSASVAAAPLAEAPASPFPSVRNVFEFADRAPVAAAPAPLPPVAVPPPLEPALTPEPPPSPIRLVGFVRRGGALRAALSLSGNLSVLGPGEEADGYSVLAVDEDAGVTVRAPDGSELVLPPPSP